MQLLRFCVIFFFISSASAMSNEYKIDWSINENYRYLFFGEIHGTKESPEVFYNFVQHAVLGGKKVIVALEIPSTEQSLIDGYMHSHDSDEASSRRSMLAGRFWNSEKKLYDGRSSVAMLNLVVSLRKLAKDSGANFSVQCVDDKNDENIAARLREALALRPDWYVYMYSGNIHAMKKHAVFPHIHTIPSFFPKNETFTIDIRVNSGTAWTCFSSNECGTTDVVEAPSSERCTGICAVRLNDNPQFDAAIIVEQATASPPANMMY